MKCSVVATLYESDSYISEFYQRASSAARHLFGDDYEIILVNDGSPDSSLDIAIDLAQADSRLIIVDLSRNFGHHKAMMTGLAQSTGDLVFLLDSDLEEEPEWLSLFLEELVRQQCDSVYGVQTQRKGGAFERVSGSLFHSLFRTLSGLSVPSNFVTARLMTRRYVDALLLHCEREINIGGLWFVTGFKQRALPITKGSTSPTTYTLSKKIYHFLNAITSFSSLPLTFTFYIGMFISFTSVLYIAYIVLRYMFVSQPPEGYVSIIASIWLFSGLIIFFIGLQGIYISKIFNEVKQRPYTIVRQIYRNTQRRPE